MISAINFGTATNNNINPKSVTPNATQAPLVDSVVVAKKEESRGIIQTSMDTIASIKKGWNILSEGTKGVFKAIGVAFATGGSVMSLDWLIQRLSGNGVQGQSLLTTPFKTAGNLIGGVVKKVAKIFSKDTSFMKVVTYPVIGFPKDVFNYVKNAKGGSKAGKAVAIALGLVALTYSAYKTLIKINKQNADIDHEYKTGHNA